VYLDGNSVERRTGGFIRITMAVMGPLVGRRLGGVDMAKNVGNVEGVPAMESDAKRP